MARPTKSEQRENIVDATVAIAAESGFGAVTVEGLAAQAGISEAEFFDQFVDLNEVLETAHEVVFEQFRIRLTTACDAQSEWPLKVRVGIGFALDFAAASPTEARFLTLDPLPTSREIIRRTVDARDRLARLLAAGRHETEYGAKLPSLTEQILVGGLISAIASRLVAGEGRRLPELAPQLVSFVLLPYLGAEEAARVARRPKPKIEGL